jgi:cystathionine beta-synthase
MKYASKLGPERLVVVILPDSGSRYLSKVFDDNWMREHGFLDLALDEASVDDIVMIHGREELVMASPSDQIGTVIALMGEHAVSQLPVVNDSNELLGIVREVDLLGCLVSADADRSVGDPIEGWIQTDVTRVPKGTGFRKVLPHLVAEKVVVIVDEKEHPHGILTTIDALEYITANKAL